MEYQIPDPPKETGCVIEQRGSSPTIRGRGRWGRKHNAQRFRYHNRHGDSHGGRPNASKEQTSRNIARTGKRNNPAFETTGADTGAAGGGAQPEPCRRYEPHPKTNGGAKHAANSGRHRNTATHARPRRHDTRRRPNRPTKRDHRYPRRGKQQLSPADNRPGSSIPYRRGFTHRPR